MIINLTSALFLFVTTIYSNNEDNSKFDSNTTTINKTNIEVYKNNCYGSITYKDINGVVETKEVNEKAKDALDCSEKFKNYATELENKGYEITHTKETFIQ